MRDVPSSQLSHRLLGGDLLDVAARSLMSSMR